MAESGNSSSSWWPKRVLSNWSNASQSYRQTNDANCDTQSVCSLSEPNATLNVIISRVLDTTDAENNKYVQLLKKRIGKHFKFGGNDGVEKQYWMPDSNAKQCYECGEKFTTIRRRHHCRICGQIFCTKCCNQEIDGKIIGLNARGNVRSCSYCHKIIMSYINDRNSDTNKESEFSQFREVLFNKNSVTENDSLVTKSSEQSPNFVSPNKLTNPSSVKRKSSVGFREEDYTKPFGRDSDSDMMPINSLRSHTSSFSSFKASLKELEFASRPDEAIHEPLWVKEINDINEEVDELASFEKVDNDLSTEMVGISKDHFKYEEKDFSQSTNSSVSTSRGLAYSSSTYDIELDFEKDRVTISKAINKKESVYEKREHVDANDEMNNEQFVVSNNSSNGDSIKDDSQEKLAYDALNNAYNNLYIKLLTQWLEEENLSLTWLNIIQKISTKVSSVVRPNSHNDVEEMDIRNYVKIKTIPNGLKNECQIINGVVFSKHVAHRKMRQNIIRPRILLLSCSIVYQRTEHKLTCLDPVLLQETEYIKNIVSKICSYKPDIILVEKTVARIAQEMILMNGITLICNVKPVVLERISRFTGASIVTSLDAQIGSPLLGMCQKFFIQTFNHKTLMFFDGCPQQLGCSIILRGSNIKELKKIKLICSFMIFCDFNWQLERSFLMDEYAIVESDHQKSQNSKELSQEVINRETHERNNKSVAPTIIDDNSDPLRSMATITCSNEAISPSDAFIPGLKDQKHESVDINEIMCTLLSKLQLSCSPFITIPMPYLMTIDGKDCELRKYFNSKLVWSKKFEIIDEDLKKNELLKVENAVRPELSSPVEAEKVLRHPLLTRELIIPSNSSEIKALISDFRAKGPFPSLTKKNTFKELVKNDNIKYGEEPDLNKSNMIDVLNPKHHQQLSVLFSSFSYASANAPNYCVKPWVINMDFYGCHDIPLGGFLERYCFNSSYSCPSNTCSTPMIEHVRRFVHSNGCILIVLRQLHQNVAAAQSSIITWSWCQKCKTGTPYSNLSSDSWSLSFAKYLEMKFYGSVYKRRATLSSVACLTHSLHQNHFQFFAYKQVVASFKYSSIIVHEIVLPPLKINIFCDTSFRNKFIENLKQIAVKGYEIYSIILEKLCSIKDETSGTKYEIIVNEFMAIETKERAFFRQKIEEIQLELVSPNIDTIDEKKIYKLEDNLINLKKLIAESIHNWNTKIQDFVFNKKKEEKLSAKSGAQSNTLSIQTKSTQQNINSEELINENHVHSNDSSYLDEQINRSISMSSSSSHLSEPNIDSTQMVNDCQKTLSASENVKNENSNSITEKTSVCDYTFTISNCDYESDIGIKPCFTVGCDNDPDFTVYDFAESSDDTKKSDDAQVSKSLVTTASETKSLLSQSLQAKPDSTPFTVKRIFKELLTNANYLTIDSPFPLSEHYLLPKYKDNLAVVVRDEDPASIIAYALSSYDYEKYLAELWIALSSPNVKRKTTISQETEKQEQESTSKSTNFESSNHIDLQFCDATTKFYCCVYYAEQFRKFRANILDVCDEELYIRSLTNSIPWKARGGKSGSTFCKTVNDRFILKEMSKLELQSFLNIANYYFDYYNRAITESRPTLLAKIVGVYRTSFKNSATNNESKLYLLVMENLFYNYNITQKFDLKGSMRNRLVDINSTNLKHDQIVLLDENLLKMTCDSPLYIHQHSKSILLAAIHNDSCFLSSHSVMDYSLLVGIDSQKSEFVVGIIDYIRPFTWDKKLESVVKSVGSQGKLPTIVQPNLYRIRFCEAMQQYFLCVPDKWFTLINYS